jgi:alanine dehydrogenase
MAIPFQNKRLLKFAQKNLYREKGARMSLPKSIGFPRMVMEEGEKRVFLPDFIQKIASMDVRVVIEEGYGSRSGFDQADYRQGNIKISFGTRQEVFDQDVVLILRYPEDDILQMKPGTILMSMLHYPTRPKRVPLFQKLGLKTISLDSIVNDNDRRLVENMKSVAWNGLEVSFGALEDIWHGLVRPDGQPIQVLVLGTGMVGKHAVDAATHLGNIERNNLHIQQEGPGVICKAVGRNITSHAKIMHKLLQQTDILVDATERRDPSEPVIPNEWIQHLPEHAILLDLSVDPYIPGADPPVVRGIEGIPKGNLNKFIFHPDDPDWEKSIAPGVPTTQRRTAVTCYSWPGFHPEACMNHYAQQLNPMMPILFEKGYDGLSLDGSYFERALYRATLKAWEDQLEQNIIWNEDKSYT